MRILELSGDTGSTNIVAENIAARLSEKGHFVRVAAPVRRRWDPYWIWHVLKTRPRYDLIHAHLGNASILAGRMGRLFGVPVLTTLHGFQKAKHYRNVAHFTAVSHAVKNHFVEQGIPSDRIRVIYNGFDPSLFHPALLPKEPGAPVILGTVGALSAVKRHHLAIDALPPLLEKHPRILLKIAGEGPLKEELKAHAKAIGLQDHVEFVGFQKNVAAFYAGLDLYLQASEREGFCMPLLEAMACGLPVVTTPSDGPTEYIADGETGLVLQEASPAVFAAAITPLLDNPDRARRIGQAAARSVGSMTWDHCVADYEALMQELRRNRG